MTTYGPAIKVGVTFVAVVAIGYYSFMILAKGSGCNPEKEMLSVHAYFHDATGLVEKSRVQISGLTVGAIYKKELASQLPREELLKQKRFAKVTIVLNKGTVLYRNAMVIKKSASLLGEFYLEIDPGTAESTDEAGNRVPNDIIKDGDELVLVSEAVTTDKVIRQVSDIIPVLKSIAQEIHTFTEGPLNKIGNNLQESIEENRESFRLLVENLEGISGDVRNITRSSGEDVQRIITDIKEITGSVRSLIGRSEGEVQGTGEKIRDSLDRLNSAIAKLDDTMANVEGITGDLQDGKGTAGRLLKDERLINDVEEVMHDTGSVIGGFTRTQTIIGLRSEYNFQANSIKTYVSVEISPRPDKYYLIELIDDPRGARKQRTLLTRTDDPSKPMLTREEQIEITDTFRFTFQFAKQVKLATFRFGIKESTGGVGIDFHLVNNRLNLQTDLFDFSANTYPRLKVLAAYEFFRRLYVVGGVDDALNRRPLDGGSGGRDYFVGAQIRFNDEDLKSFLLIGGGAIGAATK